MTNLEQTRSYAVSLRLWPAIAQMDERRQLRAVETIIQLLYLLPFAIVSLIWLAIRTDYAFLANNLDRMAVLFVAMLLLLLMPFDVRIRLGRTGEQREARELKISSSLAPLVMWSALFISGAAGLWAMVLAAVTAGLWRSWQLGRYGQNPLWEPLSTFVQNLSAYIFSTLVAATIYLEAGGQFPITSTDPENWIPALVAIAIWALLSGLLLLPVALQMASLTGSRSNLASLARFYLGAIALPLIMSPFAIIIALLNVEGRVLTLVFILIGIYLVNRLAHYLSQADARSRQQAREFAELQALGESLIEAPADASNLPQVLAEHLSRLFPVERLEIILFEPEAKVAWSPFRLSWPADPSPVPAGVWAELRQAATSYLVYKDVKLPGSRFIFGDALAVKIILEDTGQPEAGARCVGGIYLLRPRPVGRTLDSLATVQSLATEIDSALFRARAYAEEVAFRKTQQELEFAGRIQNSFLPTSVPEADQWQIAAVLDSARQTSGDFYDFIPLDDGLIGLIVADVSDKGTGAALYMALSRTLIRTYALEEGLHPEIALARANDRIRADTESDQFVTLIYGVLDPKTGKLIYANAGHNPGYLLRAGDGTVHETLARTGIPLGMFEDLTWKQAEAQLNPGDVLLFYSDGVTEAQNSAQAEFGDQRLLSAGRAHLGQPAVAIQQAIMAEINAFVGDAPQFDDITLMVIVREPLA